MSDRVSETLNDIAPAHHASEETGGGGDEVAGPHRWGQTHAWISPQLTGPEAQDDGPLTSRSCRHLKGVGWCVPTCFSTTFSAGAAGPSEQGAPSCGFSPLC